MKRNITPAVLVIVLTTFGPSVAATAQDRDATCSFARAAGHYGVSDSGTIVGIGPRAAIGLVTLDAAGNLEGKVTASLNGTIVESTAAGTYSVNPDCTGVANISEFDQSGNLVLTATETAVWDDNMREARLIFTSAKLPDGTPLTAVISVDARKLVP